MGTISSLPICTIVDVAGKGKELIATKDIPLGTRIISEKPFVTSGLHVASLEQLQVQVSQQVNSLSESQQEAFLSLHNIYPYTSSAARYRGIFRTNALPTGPSLQIGGIFLIACRINHACDNNAQNYWNDNLEQLMMHAVKDIPKGEDLKPTRIGDEMHVLPDSATGFLTGADPLCVGAHEIPNHDSTSAYSQRVHLKRLSIHSLGGKAIIGRVEII
ncbi:hypothetical protein IQ06DRAFT_348702 [Phaeosphaeriaceae sp. SRC1lsM3a]|nr:hypothetical protein IQ06DRAFT_348702 [Stagonospora sp. SRC1lsM3a]